MFELAGLLLDLLFITDMKGLHEQALRETMPADHIFGALATFLSKVKYLVAVVIV